MPLRRISLASYRCFDGTTDMELRPMTIVLGRNNSGKSALVRAPMVVEKGIRTNSPEPIDLDAIDDEIVESFTDLIYGHRPHGSITVGLDIEDSKGEPLLLAATIQHIDEYDRQVVSSLSIDHHGERCTAKWNQGNPDESDDFRYDLRLGDSSDKDVPLHFHGLLPDTNTGKLELTQIDRFLFEKGYDVQHEYPEIRYFGPFRDRPVRRFGSPTGTPRSLGSSGENAGKILAADHARRGGQLLSEVNNVLSKDLPGWSVDLNEQGNQYSIVLQSKDDPALNVNLADAGTGVAQVLPVFVQRALDVLTPPKTPVLEIMEQPELHLHPAAHGGLADLYLTAALRGNIQFLIETHSETLLLRIRRRIAEGLIEPEQVALYFVEHERGRATSRRINIGHDGGLDYWPDGVFSEDYEEARALTIAQLNSGGQDAR